MRLVSTTLSGAQVNSSDSRLAFDISKRAFDILASAAGIVVLSPVMVVTAVLVARNLGRPVLFIHRRPGKDGKPFNLLKFRTMRAVDPKRGLISDQDRLTPFGRRIRATSLDELPELVNVLLGDMSLVGPRPLLEQYLPLYSTEQARRHEIRPGITGLAQVSGRNALSWEEKFALDISYVDARSWLLDARILVQTLLSVLRREGISADGQATMPAFAGTAVSGQCDSELVLGTPPEPVLECAA